MTLGTPSIHFSHQIPYGCSFTVGLSRWEGHSNVAGVLSSLLHARLQQYSTYYMYVCRGIKALFNVAIGSERVIFMLKSLYYPCYLVELPLVLDGPDIASYGQLLRQLLVLGCQPFYDLLQGELQLPTVVREGLKSHPANTHRVGIANINIFKHTAAVHIWSLHPTVRKAPAHFIQNIQQTVWTWTWNSIIMHRLF